MLSPTFRRISIVPSRIPLVPALFLAAFLTIDLAGQPVPGNVIALTTRHVLDVVPGGAVTTLTTLPSGHDGFGLCASFNNRGVALLTRHATATADTSYVMELQNGVLRTLGSIRQTGTGPRVSAQGGVVRDQRGDYIATTPLGVVRIPAIGGPSQRLDRMVATGISEHLSAGGWMLFAGGQVLHLTRAAQKVKLGALTGPTVLGAGGIFTDTTTGDAFLTYSRLYKLTLKNAQIVTLATGSPFGIIRAGDIDPRDRSLVLGTSSGVYRVDGQGRLLATVARLNTGVVGVTVFGSNHVSASGPSTPGSTWTVQASFPADAGRFYQLGAALGFTPGIPTPRGLVSLTPDPLFFLAFLAPAIFQRFSGQLDSSGTALAAIAIPAVPALKGLRLFVVGLTYDSQGKIHTISEPEGLTIE